MTEISEPDAADAKWKLQREEEEWTQKRDIELKKRVPLDKASSEELMFKGKGELGKGGPRKMEQPPQPDRDAMPTCHKPGCQSQLQHGQGFLPRSAASTEGNRGPVTRKVVRCREGVGAETRTLRSSSVRLFHRSWEYSS